MKKAKTIMVQGTGSGVGKSVIVSALCRIFLQDGYRVCPFKAQNMALNSFVTRDAREIGRAQAVQAQACGIDPTVDMNPVLLKPTSQIGAQVVVRGRPIGNMTAIEYSSYKPKLLNTVRESFDRLAYKYDIVVIEGAGSPAEINLKARDIVNMKMAEYARSPVILAGDIDKGGIFAWLWGTVDLLSAQDRRRIKALLINKFRGDKKLLLPGIDFLEKKTKKKVLGVIPYFNDINLPEEDSLSLDKKEPERELKNPAVKIEVIRLPHISNFTDFDALKMESCVGLSFIENGKPVSNDCDVLILPGTKNTIFDFDYLVKNGYIPQISRLKKQGFEIVGICGGFQMLGRQISDPLAIESENKRSPGLGFLNMSTTLAKEKMLSQVKARELSSGIELCGYEIHHGRSAISGDLKPVFEIVERKGRKTLVNDGAVSLEGNVWGTYIHGIFDDYRFRSDFLKKIIKRKNGKRPAADMIRGQYSKDEEFDKLADLVRKSIDEKLLYRIIG